MNHTEEKIIELSKAKLLKIFVLACVFVYLGAWMFQMDAAEIESHRRFNSPLLVHGMGVVAVIFFGLCGLWSFKKLFDNRPGLILDSKGIMDNSSGIAAGLVPWTEITGFRIYEVKKQKMLVILLKSPETYIEMGGGAKRALNRMNYKLCGSPLVISPNALKIGFNDLLESCHAYFSKYGKSA